MKKKKKAKKQYLVIIRNPLTKSKKRMMFIFATLKGAKEFMTEVHSEGYEAIYTRLDK